MPKFIDVLGALETAGIRYVAVGGVAVVLHGHPRLTADLDLVLDPDEDNLRSALGVLGDLGFRPAVPVDLEDFVDIDVRRGWIEERGMTVFPLQHAEDPVHAVDLFAEPPLPFDELWAESRVVMVEGRPVRIASIDHLIRMKRQADRPQDRQDARALEEIRDRRDR